VTSTIPLISTKQTITSHLKSLNIKRSTAYDIGNPGPRLGQAQKCCGVKSVKGISTSIHDALTNTNKIKNQILHTCTCACLLQN